MWQSKVLDGLQGFIESFSLTNSQHLIFQKAVKKTLPLKDLSLLPPKLAEFFMSSEPIRIVSDVEKDPGIGIVFHDVSIERSLNSNVPNKIPARKISLEQPLEKVAEKLSKLKTAKQKTVKKINKTALKAPEGKLLRIDALKTRQIIFERSTPRIFSPGQVFGFQREYHEYLVESDIYPDHVPMPKALHDMLLKNMTPQGRTQFEEYDFRLFRSRILADADEFCGGICVDEKKEILFAEDFMQWLEFGEERGGEKGEGIKTAYILDVLSHSTNPEISKAANKLLEKTDSKTLGELYKLTQRYKEAEKKYHNNKKPLRIKPITHVATTAAIEENMLKILGAITQAKDEGYHLAYFPELITSSYQLEGVIASPDFLERHDQELFEINRYVRFMFAKEAHQFLNQILNEFSVLKTEKDAFLKEFFKQLYLYDLEFTYIENLPKQNNGYLNWLKEIDAVPSRLEMKEYNQKKFGRDHYEENTNYYHGDNQPLDIDKQEDIYRLLKVLLNKHFNEPGLSKNVLQSFFNKYDDFGIAMYFGAIVRSNYDRPYNGSYVYKNDGTVVPQLKKYLATETDNYFDEDKAYIKGDIHFKDEVEIRGHILFLIICEMIFREGRIRATGMGMFPVIPIAALKYLRDPQLRKKYLRGEILNLAGESILSMHASPERHPAERAYPLHKVNWKNLPAGFSIHDGLGIHFENDRNETRKEIIKAITQYYGVDMVYLNTVGGYDIIAMGGGRILVDAKGKVIASHLNFQQGSTGFYLDGLSKIHLVDEKQVGEHAYKPLQETRAGIIQTTLHFLSKNQMTFAAMHHAGDETSSLMVKYLEEVEKANHLIHEKRVVEYFQTVYENQIEPYTKNEVNSRMRRAVYKSRLWFQSPQKIIRSEIKRTVSRFGIRRYVYGMPTLNPIKFIPKMFNFIGDKLRYRFEMQFNFIYFPDIMISHTAAMVPVHYKVMELLTGTPFENYALPFWSSAILSFPIYSVGLSFLVRTMLADFLWWPLFNALGKILAFTRWYRYIPSERIKRKPTMGENIRHPIDKSYAPGLHHYSKNMDTIPKSPTSYQRLERWSDLFNGYFSDLASEVRGALLQRVLKIKKKFGKNGVALGHISQKEIFLGQFPAGGVESGGWNMFLTINPNLKEALTIMEFKKDLALKTNIIWRNYKSWRFKSYLKKSASKSLAKSWFTNLMRRYLKPWPINKSAQWYYLRYHWIEILNDATDPKRKVQIEKIVSQFTKKINKLEEKGIQPIMNAKVRAPWRLPLSSEYRMRSTRGNKTMASQFMFAVLSQQLSYRDLRKIAVLKYTADPYDQLKDKDYSESAVHMIDRMQETRHKTQSLQGPAFNISVPTSFREPISQKPINKPRTRMLILHHLKEFERILIPDDVSLYHLLSQGIQAIEFDFSRNHYVERTAEKTYIERKILEAKEKNKNGKPILVIKYLNSETDQHAFNFARKNDFDIIVLTSRQRLNTLKIPGDKNGIRKLGKVRLVDTEEELAQLDKLLPVKKFKFDEAE